MKSRHEASDFAVERFGKEEYFYSAENNGALVGAMHFSIQEGVGQLVAKNFWCKNDLISLTKEL